MKHLPLKIFAGFKLFQGGIYFSKYHRLENLIKNNKDMFDRIVTRSFWF